MDIFLAKFEPNSTNKIELKKQQSTVSKEVINHILKNFYNHPSNLLKAPSGMPYLEDGFKYISISHSDEYIATAFDDSPIGIDIEKIKPRDYKKILEHYNQNPNITLEEFYKWWTIYEAEYKSKIKQNTHSFEIDNYMCSVSIKNSSVLTYIVDSKNKNFHLIER